MKNTMEREYDFSRAKRGPVISVPKGKTRITIRLDDEILAWLREQVERDRRAAFAKAMAG